MSTLSVDKDQVTIVQSAYKCQPLPVLIRVTQGSSTWKDIGGLQSVIPSSLSLGLIGYPLFIPEAVGGSAFNGLPSKELYIRWLQVATFFPILHLSIAPNTYDTETVAIADKMFAIRRDFVVPRVHRILNESADVLAPIIRPLWWLAPTDQQALIIDSQFLLGDTVLVAPIVEEGSRYRDIYIPPGDWQDQLSHMVYKGPVKISNHPVPLDHVPYFVRR
jgi:alpha-glucosidase (family GH31 glycosyl hydrolase)